MGQAKIRGTKEQRIAFAIQRNEQLLEESKSNHEFTKALKTTSIQQIANRLTSAQVIPSVFQVQLRAARERMEKQTSVV